MKRIAEQMFVARVYAAQGEPGTLALKEIMAFVLRLYTQLDPGSTNGTIYVFRRRSDSDATAISKALAGSFSIEKQWDRLPKSVEGVLVIDLLDGGVPRFAVDATLDEVEASNCGVVYRFKDKQEHFLVNGQTLLIENPSSIHASIFSRPSFESIREALQDYTVRQARHCSCKLLRLAWDDEKRLFFSAGPEDTIRDSVTQFLQSVLRDAEVRPEQNVDESHPVDIKVTWSFTVRLALVEIKWLGKSRRDSKLATEYTEVRARQGAAQLAGYLDTNRTNSPTRHTRGYLLVVDGRRRGLNEASGSVTKSNGLHYLSQEIDYNPKYHELRDDFDVPVRAFVEPIWDK